MKRYVRASQFNLYDYDVSTLSGAIAYIICEPLDMGDDFGVIAESFADFADLDIDSYYDKFSDINVALDHMFMDGIERLLAKNSPIIADWLIDAIDSGYLEFDSPKTGIAISTVYDSSNLIADGDKVKNLIDRI